MSNESFLLDRTCEQARKMGGINYESKRCLEGLVYLKDLIGNGKSHRTEEMTSMVADLERRIANIERESK